MWKEIVRANTDKDGSMTLSGAAASGIGRLAHKDRDPILPRAGYERLAAGLVSGRFVERSASVERAVDNSLAEEAARERPTAIVISMCPNTARKTFG